MRTRAIVLAVLCGTVLTLLFCIDLVAASFIVFDWGGADPFTGESGNSVAWWAVPAWLAVTIVLIVADVFAVRHVYRHA